MGLSLDLGPRLEAAGRVSGSEQERVRVQPDPDRCISQEGRPAEPQGPQDSGVKPGHPHLGWEGAPKIWVPQRTGHPFFSARCALQWLWVVMEAVVAGSLIFTLGDSQCWGAGERGHPRGRPGHPGNPHGA